MSTPASSASIALPFYLRRTIGLRTRRIVPFDAVVALRRGEATFMLTHPDDVKHVLISNAANYTKTRYLASARGRQRAGHGLLTLSGAEHRRQRQLLQPLFHERVIERFCDVIDDRLERLTSRLEGTREIELAGEMAGLTRSVLLGVLFGFEADACAPLEQAIHARRLYTDFLYHGRLPLRDRLPTPILLRNRRALRHIDDTIRREIARRRAAPEGFDDLLSRLMNATRPDGSRMNDDQLRDEALTFTSTGYETLGEALAWTLHLLTANADAQRELTSEVRALGDGPFGRDAAARLPFVRSVLQESMRLYPPTWIFERVPIAGERLPSGASVPAGAKLYLCPWVLHRHPEHFPEPEVFRPSRFEGAGPRPYRFVYLPFGDGPHTCIGETFAMLQGVRALATLGRRFRFETLPGQRIVPRAGITLSPRHGIRARVVPLRD